MGRGASQKPQQTRGFVPLCPTDGAQDFWLAFFPHSAIFEGGVWTGFDPLENRVYRAFEGTFRLSFYSRAFPPRGLN